MTIEHTQTCGVQEICGLSGHTPRASIAAFCRLELGRKPKYHGNEWNAPNKIFCFYLFTANLGEYSGNYGPYFAAYIKKNKLGHVAATPATQNEAFHPEHKNQAWLWTPDVKALEAWWKEHKPVKE